MSLCYSSISLKHISVETCLMKLTKDDQSRIHLLVFFVVPASRILTGLAIAIVR